MCPATRTAGVKVHHSRGFLACARRAHYERHVVLGPCPLVATLAACLWRGPRRSAPLPVAALLLALRGGVGRPPARARRPSCWAIPSQHREPQPPQTSLLPTDPAAASATLPQRLCTLPQQGGKNADCQATRRRFQTCVHCPAAAVASPRRGAQRLGGCASISRLFRASALCFRVEPWGPAQTALHCASGVRRQACGQRQGQQADCTRAPCTLASFHSKEWGSVMARGSPPMQASAAARPGRAGAVLVSRPAMPPFPRKRTAPCSPSCNASRQGRARCGLRLLHSCPTARASSAGTGE